MISAIVLTKNEEENIERCLKSLLWCDEILVIDDNSTDGTIGLIRQIGQIGKKIKIYKRYLNGDFAQQRNFGLEKTKGDWVLFVDADEEVTSNLANEIRNVTKEFTIANQIVTGFYLKRSDYFMGRWLKHGEIGGLGMFGLLGEAGGFGGIKLLRLGRKEAGKWERKVDEIWDIKGKTQVLRNPLLHFPHQTLDEFLISINERSSMNAKEFFNQGRKITFFDWLKPLGKFISNYFFKLGFLDGAEGFVFAVLMSLHSFLVRGKLYLLITKENKENRRVST